MKYLVNVKVQNNDNAGCFYDSFDSLDDVRAFAKASAASFRKTYGDKIVCTLFMMKNGDRIENGRTLEC